MEYLIISIVAFLVAILTFFSGFGLGTILTPAFILFFPVEIAITLTGVVHFFNNIFKLFLVGKNANKEVLLRFGIPAVIFAFIGSLVLVNISYASPLFTYTAYGNEYLVYPVKFTIALILFIFAVLDLIPAFNNLQFDKSKLPIGGMLSGFFGGLSGNQGALRSAFLIKAGLSKEAFIGTAVVVSTFVDFTRLSVYSTRFMESGLIENIPLLLLAILSGIAGSFIGNKLLKKVTLKFLQVIVAIMLMILSLALGAGVL